MEDPKSLREVARRWRAMARFHDPSASIALVTAASQLEAEADRLEGGKGAARAAQLSPA